MKTDQLIRDNAVLMQEKAEQSRLLRKLTDENLTLKSAIAKVRDS